MPRAKRISPRGARFGGARNRRHADHRPCRDRGELAYAGAPAAHRRMRRRGQGQCLWPRPATGDDDAGAGRLQDVLRRRSCRSAHRALARARRHDLRARWLYAGLGRRLIEINARPVINSTTELAEWDAFVGAHGWQGGAALHVDTGMHRLGITPDEAAALAPRAQTENHGIALLLSHLACAEIPDHPLNAKQIELFRELHMLYPASRLRWRIPPVFFSAIRRISIWRGRAPRSTASIPRPAVPIRCRASSN